MWTEGTRHLATPGVGWIIDQNLGNVWPRIDQELTRGLHATDEGLILEYLRGPPEVQPPPFRRQGARARVPLAVSPDFTRLRKAFFQTTNGDLAVVLSQVKLGQSLDVVPQYYLLLNFAIRRGLTLAEDRALTGPFGELVNPILQAIRRDCQTPFLFRKLRTPAEMEPDPLRNAERQSLCLLEQPIRKMWEKITARIEAILPPLARVQYGKWKAQGMQLSDTRLLGCWNHYRELILHWAFDMAQIPTSPHSTAILRQLILQRVSEIWIQTNAIQWTEDVSQAYALGQALLPLPFQSPRAGPEPRLARPLEEPRLQCLIATPSRGLTLSAQNHALLMRLPMRIPVVGEAPSARILQFHKTQGGEQLPWSQGLPQSRNLVPGGRELQSPSASVAGTGSFKAPGLLSTGPTSQGDPSSQGRSEFSGGPQFILER